MTGKYTCPECRYTNGWHEIDDGNPEHQPQLVRCPNRAITEQVKRTEQLAADEHSAARDAARAVVRDGAQRLAVLSANMLRDEIRDAGLEGREGLMGAAFAYAARQGWVEWTGRMVASAGTSAKGHKIMEYRSLLRDGTKARVS